MQNPYGDVFESYAPWSGSVPAGYTASFLGSLARIDRLYPGKYISVLEKKAAQDYHDTPPLPRPQSPNYYEMGAVLSAVNRASGEFNMLELGAGTGPWTASAAHAAARKGITSRYFIAVEAEPTRFEWLHDNMAVNGISGDERHLVRAVVFPSGKADTNVYFPVGAPLFAGHGARSSETELDGPQLTRKVEYVGRVEDAVLEAAPVVTLGELLRVHRDRVFDVAHIDIQGVEDQVIEDAADMIQTNLRSVAIGTHGAKIEENLHRILARLGWTCVFSFGTNSTFEVDGAVISTKGLDGFQHWVNPKLT